jgi:2'-5' RNA ligase
MIRLFAGVAVPEAAAQALTGAQTGIAGARWRPIEALHITLRFFGDIREDQAEDLDVELARLPGRPFDLQLRGAGSFGHGPDVDAVWAGVVPSEPLNVLAQRCEAAARRAGLKPVTRNYLPHVTLAYLTRPPQAQVAAWIAQHNLLTSGPFTVSDFRLYSSRLLEGGSRYEVERVYRLG